MNDDTPRTDAAIKEVLQSGPHQKVKADFARQLERDLAEAQRQIGLMLQIVFHGAQFPDAPKSGKEDSTDYDDYTHFDHPSLAIECRKVLRELRGKSV